MAALREILVAFGITVDSAQLDKASDKTEGFKQKLGQVAGALAAAFALDKVKDFVFGMVSAADAVGDQAARLGLSTRALEEWTFQAKFADLEAGELNGVFDKLARTSNAAAEAGSEQAKTLKKLGVDVKDTSGQLKDTSQLFEEVGLALAGLDNETERTALSFEFFGKTAGPKVLQMFKDGPAGLAKFRAEFEELGGGFGDFVEAAGQVDDQMHRLDLAWVSAKTKIAGLLLPAVLSLMQGITRAVSFFSKLAKETNLVQSALVTLGAIAIALGAKVLIAWGPVLLVTAAWAAAIALVVLALDDIITFFQGGDSLIGRAIEEWFGPGSSEKVREWGRSVLQAFDVFLSGAGAVALDTLLALLDLIGLAFADNSDEVDKFADRFFEHSAGIARAIDSLIDKLSVLKSLWPGNWDADVINGGLEDLSELAESGAASVFGFQTRAERARNGGGSAPAAPGAPSAPLTSEGIKAAFLGPQVVTASGPPVRDAFGPGVKVEAPIVNNFVLPPGTPAATARAAAEAGNRGSAAGVNRAAAAAFDKRGRK